MKNKLLVLATISLLSTGCSRVEFIESTVKVICPTGAPAVAFYNHASDENFETNGAPANILSFLNASSPYDVVVIDTVSGLKAIKNGAPYKMHSTITFGNFFIASTGNDEDETMSSDDKIVLFGKNQTPDLLFHYIYGNQYDDAIEYVNAVTDAASCLASGKNVLTGSDVDYVFIAQPALFSTLNNTNAPTYGKSAIAANIQELYKNKTNNKSIVQASVFVKNGSNCDEYLEILKSDIETLLDFPTEVETALGSVDEDEVKAKYGVPARIMKAVVANNNGLGLGFKKARDNLADINNFINIFGLEGINEDYVI
ncbi:MAG: hypothetical protein MJZ37_05765 [Bacilli bacterium]|nr:hypothetical protein [Bacilli bacterium]